MLQYGDLIAIFEDKMTQMHHTTITKLHILLHRHGLEGDLKPQKASVNSENTTRTIKFGV